MATSLSEIFHDMFKHVLIEFCTVAEFKTKLKLRTMARVKFHNSRIPNVVLEIRAIAR